MPAPSLPRSAPRFRGLLWIALAVLVLTTTAAGSAFATGVVPPHTEALPQAPAASAARILLPDELTPQTGSGPPTLTTAITNYPKTIYTYKNEQEQDPQDSQVSLFVNATGGAVGAYANVQVVFVVETTPYDGVYDPTQDDTGVNNPCDGPCEESTDVPYFTANAGRIAQDIADNNPYSTVTFAMVDYFATLTDHDDGDGAEYHVDVPTFVAANKFQAAVVSGFQDPVLGGNWYYSDSDFSDCFLGSSEITALYGALLGSGLGWIPGDHHVIVILGSTAPRDPSFVEDYAYTHSDWDSGNTTTCEPSYNYGNGVTSPDCERWVTGSSSDAALANSEGVNVDYVDDFNGITQGTSQDYTQAAGGIADATTILEAGCDMAIATGGSWDGPPGFSCSAAETGTGQGNLTCSMGTSCFQGQVGNAYNNPPIAWTDNSPLAWALTHISFGPTSVSNVTATGNGVPMFQFVPATNITPDPTNPAWTVVCLHNGVPLSGCQQSPTITSSGSANVYAWNWPVSTMYLNDTWEATFNVVAMGGPFNQTYSLDACTVTTPAGCKGTVGNGAYTLIDYKNFQGTATVSSFPPSDIYVVYPGMVVSVTPAFSRGTPGFSQSFTVSATGGQPPYAYQWYVNGVAQTGATSSNFNYVFTTVGTNIVRCLVFDTYNPTKGVSGTAQVIISPSLGSLFTLQGNVTDATTGAGIPGAVVAINGTAGSTYSTTGGAYSLGAISNGTYTIYVNATTYNAYSATFTLSGNTWVNVALTPTPPTLYPVQGFLSDFANGAPIAGAGVDLDFSGVPYANATTSATGHFVMNVLNASYVLTATASGFYPGNLTVNVAGVGVWANLSLTPLPPQRFYFTGNVIDNTTRSPVVGALVTLNYTQYNTTTDSNGIFLFPNLLNGTYIVGVSAAGYYADQFNIRVYGAGVTRTVVLDAMPPPGPPSWTLGGTVLSGATHLTLPNATITVNTTTGKVFATVEDSTSGDYVVGSLQNGTYSATATAPGYEPASFTFVINGSSWVQDFYLTPAGGGQFEYISVTGSVLNASDPGSPIADATVELTPTSLSSTVTSDDGVYLFPSVPASTGAPEDLILTAYAPGYSWTNETIAIGTANVEANLYLVPRSLVLYTLTGVVWEKGTDLPVAGATVALLGSPIVVSPVTTNALTGGFSFQEVPGTWEIEATASGYEPSFTNVTLSHTAVNGITLYLQPRSAATSGAPSSSQNGLFSPGFDGLYLQIWVPVLVAALLLVFIWRHHRRHEPRAPAEIAAPATPEPTLPGDVPPAAP